VVECLLSKRGPEFKFDYCKKENNNYPKQILLPSWGKVQNQLLLNWIVYQKWYFETKTLSTGAHWVELPLLPNFFIIISDALGVHCDIYKSSYNISYWIHPLHLLCPPSSHAWNSFKDSFSIFVHVYIVFPPHLPSYTLPYILLGWNIFNNVHLFRWVSKNNMGSCCKIF
jgi:hypothetical protein